MELNDININNKCIKIFIEINDLEIINYFKHKIDKKRIFYNINKLSSNQNKNNKLLESLNTLGEDKIFLPFDENTKDNEKENKMIICACLWGKSHLYFEYSNGKIIDKLDGGQIIKCILTPNVYVKTTADTNVEYIDINLCPDCIYE